MNQLNSLIIEGNLCKKPELKSTSNNHKLVVFPIAVNRNYKKNDGTYETEVSYFDIEAWGDLMSTKYVANGKCSVDSIAKMYCPVNTSKWIRDVRILMRRFHKALLLKLDATRI